MAAQIDINDLSDFFNELHLLVSEIENRDTTDKDKLECMEFKARLSLENLLHLHNEVINCRSKIVKLVDILHILLQEIHRDIVGFSRVRLPRVAIIDYKPEKVKRDGPGRPKYQISEDVLLYFRELVFCWKDIASMLCISRWTISRRVSELGLNDVTGYSKIADDELERIIEESRQSQGISVGRSMVLGYLTSQGLKVQHSRVTETLRKIDPVNSKIRWASLVRRRKYSVPAPNCLWHIDGHHSLINWKFVIHGGIDGFSRLITFLHCSTNNKKETVLELFADAITRCGVPSRVRSDKGGENVLVWDRMLELRGDGRGSYLAGSSVHNQRIERLWRDVWTYVCYQFYYTFQAMEDQGK